MDSPRLGQQVKLKGGDMQFLVTRIDVGKAVVDLTPMEFGFSVAKNVPFSHILDAVTGDGFIESLAE